MSQTLDLKTVGNEITVTGDNFTFVFDKARGYLKSWTAGAVELLEPDPSTGAAIIPSFWRPPTDNDYPSSLPYWQRYGVDAMTSQLRSTTIRVPSHDDDWKTLNKTSDSTASAAAAVQLVFTTFLSPPVLDWGYLATSTYAIHASGALTITVRLEPTGAHPAHVPRAGLNLRLPRRLDSVKWLGLGPGESYPDKRGAQRVGVWGPLDVAADMHTPYEVPQENGNRMGTRWVSVRESGGGAGGSGVRVVAADDGGTWSGNCERQFSFAVSRFSDRAIQEAAHPCDLVEEPATLLRLDGRVAGVGTGACGPAVREDLMVPVEEMAFGFQLQAVGV